MNKRQPGVDMMRCIGLLFVVGVHSFLKNGFYYEPQTGPIMWAANSFRWLFYSCNGIFMLLTGYLKSTKPLNKNYYKSLLAVMISYVLTCLITFPIRHYLLDERLSFQQWWEKFITFGNYAWYVEMYIGLFLFSPIINLALEQLKTKKQLYWMGGTMLLLTALPSVTNYDILPDYWKALYPFTYYVLGALIRRMQPRPKPWLCLTGTGLIAAGLGLTSLLFTDEGFSKGYTLGYGGFWVMAMVVLLFLAVYQLRIRPGTGKVLGWMAGGCFEGYILSRLLDIWVYDLFPQWHTPKMYPLLFIHVTVPIFCISLLAGKGVNALSGLILRLVTRHTKQTAASK